jgi:hypothetical protein
MPKIRKDIGLYSINFCQTKSMGFIHCGNGLGYFIEWNE